MKRQTSALMISALNQVLVNKHLPTDPCKHSNSELRKVWNALACISICIAQIDRECTTHKVCEAHDDIQEQHLLDGQVLVADEPAVGDWNEPPAAHH